ncbi:early nodulin-93-like [Dioscorea cayenensis subsp. rotundata]|uniref:Early nodulin-93-like n=1 Tax=Dioscorea cayennensis subsp. rotundata TaxID=55577 RepID=A0AB40CYL5_DIOCR|nr:early nodulin-93-like [Dioscorea cayenensis subsp. rotundata]
MRNSLPSIQVSSLIAASPDEQRGVDSKSSIREAVQEGFKNASIAAAVTAVPTLVGCRVIPWAKANLNHTAQALIISAAGIAAFFVTADKTILGRARENSMGKYDKTG